MRRPAEGAQEESDDAPQFFDRRSLEKLRSGTPSTQAPPPAPSQDPAQLTTAPRAPVATPPSRFPFAWAVVAFIAVGLVVAVALALR